VQDLTPTRGFEGRMRYEVKIRAADFGTVWLRTDDEADALAKAREMGLGDVRELIDLEVPDFEPIGRRSTPGNRLDGLRQMRSLERS
jgi:hypothetical protein